VYEAYNMYGTIAPGTLGWGNYTEHCGGYLWALTEGPLGVDFDSDRESVATLHPHFPSEWTQAQTRIYLRGTRVRIEYARTGGKATVSLVGEEGPAQPIRVVLPAGGAQVIRVAAGVQRTFDL
jgi:cellobiose phosphorylase